MKRFNLLLGILFLAFSANAQLSQLDLFANNQEPFTLIWNGQELATNISQVSITELEAGQHQVQIVKQKYYPTAYGQPIIQPQIVFNGMINIAPNTLVVALLQNNQIVIQNQTALIPQYSNPYGGNYYYSNNPPNGNAFGQVNNGYNNNYSPGYPIGNCPPPPPPSCGHPSGINNSYYGPQQMDASSFQQLKSSISNQWFSSGQMDVFEQALNSNFFTSQQVNEIVQLFTFSSDKLAVAKKAYTKTVDPQNYFVVNNSLEYSSSVNALSAYIASL